MANLDQKTAIVQNCVIMTDLQCNDIETCPIDDETPSLTAVGKGGRTAGSQRWYTNSRRQRRPKTFSVDSTLESPSNRYTSSRKEHLPATRYTRRKAGIVRQKSSSLYLPDAGRTRDHSDGGPDKAEDKVLMTGWLYKTSRLKTSKARAHRQHRKFKLTAHSLEYSHFNLQKVKVQKQFPLTSIVDIIYDEVENSVEFKLVFQKVEVILEAHDPSTCKQWVENITKAWKQWNIAYKQFNVANKDASSTEVVNEYVTEDTIDPETVAYLKRNQDYLEKALRNLKYNTPGLVTSLDVVKQHFGGNLSPRSKTKPSSVTDEQTSSNSVPYPRRKGMQRFRTRIGLAPRVTYDEESTSFSNEVGNKNDFALLSKSNFAMIKYPRNGHSIPHERVFKMDLENLLIMWHRTENSKFSYLQTLMTEHIVDVREGQDSDGFDRYPYEEMQGQSLSILVEGEKQTVPGGRKYAVLQSLDLICDSPKEQQLWYHVLKQLISPKYQLYCSRFESTDPTIMWLTTHWSVLTNDGEIKEDAALCFGSRLVPQFKHSRIQELLNRAHQCQLKESQHHGHSLHWDGFVFFFNLLCGIDNSSCLLMKIFQKYAEKYSSLGMTVEEFQKFLIEYQHWSPEDATNEKCVQLMLRYDYHYRAYKMHKANSTPFEFNISLCLLSFGGFLSFLRSPDNSVIDKKHEEVYQDMTQPLSHYFINSSHNTYLEGHQLTGLSTTDAYARALLQGCRCLEIDCWDGADGQPRVTHGKTLVSDLSLVEVAETINKYAFTVSSYPLILSLENHCSPEQQAKMAEIFTKIFGEKLAKENLVQTNNLDRLPSPHQLQRKIILKGTDRSSIRTPRKSPLIPGVLKKISSVPIMPMIPKTRKTSQVSIPESIWSDSQLAAYEPQLNTLDEFLPSKEDNQSQQEEAEEAGDDDNDDIEENDLSDEKLSDLIVYCRSKRIRPWSWAAQKTTSVCNMFSFNESTALTRCRDTSEMLACTERQFIRTYPAGTRIDSSNYDPIPLWNHGIQIVALNVQTPENFMFLNQGKFRQNGGCGYVLKPKVMRTPFKTEYTPNMEEPLQEVTPINLEITLISGQHLMVPSKKTVSVEIHYETYGIPQDCEKQKFSVNNHTTNPLWPQFHGSSPLEKTIYMPGLCLVLFAVYIRVSRKLQAGTRQILLGQNVFPLESLKPGLHFIPLRTPSGESTSHIGIFAKIKMSKLSQKQASSSGTCSLQDLPKSPTNELSSPLRFLEICTLSPDETVEDKGSELHSAIIEEQVVSMCSPSDGVINVNSVNFPCNQPKVVRQEAVVEFTVEIHDNSSTDI